jgi:hypothetical protein
MFFVIECPRFMEDEGRYYLVKWTNTKNEAEQFIKDRVVGRAGWDSPGDYIIATAPER